MSIVYRKEHGQETFRGMTPTPKRKSPNYSVIFADDDEDTLAMLYALGRKQGWDVEIADSAEQLLHKVELRCKDETVDCFDIVVTDVNFFSSTGSPGVSGIAAARQLERAFPNLPILFLSGYGGLLTRENIKEIKTAEYIEKPVDPTYLVARIEYLINFTQNRYEGPERRKTSVNRTHFNRRSTDNNLGIPKVLRVVMGRTSNG